MFNKSILIGRLTADPELKTTPHGKNVCAFTIAVDRFGKTKAVDFIQIEAWERTAEFVCRYFSKGKAIGIDGHIQVDRYEKDGEKRTAFKVIADRAFFTGDKGNEPPQISEEVEEADDLPF